MVMLGSVRVASNILCMCIYALGVFLSMQACMFGRMYVCMHVCMYACMLHEYKYVFMNECVHACIYLFACMCACTYA